MKTAYQLWGIAPPLPDWNGLPVRLNAMQKACPAHVVICGLDAPEEIYRVVREETRKYGTQLYLWIPVFSELDTLTDYEPLIDHHGKAFLEDHSGGFKFRCPASLKNVDTVLVEAEKHLSRGEFDGVFLDRIRYPSFQYGLSGALSCYWAECENPQAVREACLRLERRIKDQTDNPLGLQSFDGSRWTLDDPDLQALFDGRCSVITRQLKKICAFFKQRGYKVGLDLFTPALSYFAGQHFADLCMLADFVKPMLYLQTDAPAGLPYEMRVMDEALGGTEKNAVMRLLEEKDLRSFASGEVARMARVKAAKGFAADILCGVEYNRVLPITPASPDTIHQDIAGLRAAGAEGITASWNLFYTPEENLLALLEALS